MLILTAAHVINGCEPGDPVEYAPADAPGSRVKFGTLRRAVPLAPLPFVAVDAAVIKPDPGFDWEYDNAPSGVWPKEPVDLWQAPDNEPVDVYKKGPATGFTRGSMFPVAADHFMQNVRARYTSGWWVAGDGELFAAPGDSGSAVFDIEHRFVGLVVALERHPGPDDTMIDAYVHGARQIMTALNIELDPEPPPKRGRE